MPRPTQSAHVADIGNEDHPRIVWKRVENTDNPPVLLTQADVASLTVDVHEMESGSAIAGSPFTLVVADVILDTTVAKTVNGVSTAMNFRHVTPAAYLPTGGKSYVLSYTVTLVAGGDPLKLKKVILPTTDLLAS